MVASAGGWGVLSQGRVGLKVASMAGLKVGLYGLGVVERVEGGLVGGKEGRGVGVRWKPGL